jgi:hypothetical protein
MAIVLKKPGCSVRIHRFKNWEIKITLSNSQSNCQVAEIVQDRVTILANDIPSNSRRREVCFTLVLMT